MTPGGFRLTPLYEVMSVAPCSQYSPQKVKLALAIGDGHHYRLKTILPRHFYQTAQKAGIAKQDMDELFADVLTRINPAIEGAAALADKAGMPPKTADAIFTGIRHRAGLAAPYGGTSAAVPPNIDLKILSTGPIGPAQSLRGGGLASWLVRPLLWWIRFA